MLPLDDGVSSMLLCLSELSRFCLLLFKAGLGWATAPAAAPADEFVDGTDRFDIPLIPGLF